MWEVALLPVILIPRVESLTDLPGDQVPITGSAQGGPKVWKSLASLSEEYARERKNDLYDWETHEGESPLVPTTVSGDTRTEIVSLIYTFSIDKVVQRYKKWWPKLSGLFKEYRTGYDRLTGPTVGEFKAHVEGLLANLNMVAGYIKRM